MKLNPIFNVQTPHAEFVQDITEQVIDLAESLCRFVVDNPYLALAGLAINQLSGDLNQIGQSDRINLSICAIRTNRSMAFAAINPMIEEYSPLHLQSIETCLTWPKQLIRAVRHESVRVSYIDIKGNKKYCEAEGFLAKVWQHEINHLYGIAENVYPVPQKQQPNEKCQCGSGNKFKMCCGR